MVDPHRFTENLVASASFGRREQLRMMDEMDVSTRSGMEAEKRVKDTLLNPPQDLGSVFLPSIRVW